MFDMGFLPDIRRIIKHIPAKRQTLLFSATMPDDIRRLAHEVLHAPVTVQVGHTAPANTVSHALYPIPQHLKTALLLELLRHTDTESVLIFTRTKHRAKTVGRKLEQAGYRAASLQGNLSQNKRQAALDGFPQRLASDPRGHGHRGPRHRCFAHIPRHQLRHARHRRCVHAPDRPHRQGREDRRRLHLRDPGRRAHGAQHRARARRKGGAPHGEGLRLQAGGAFARYRVRPPAAPAPAAPETGDSGEAQDPRRRGSPAAGAPGPALARGRPSRSCPQHSTGPKTTQTAVRRTYKPKTSR